LFGEGRTISLHAPVVRVLDSTGAGDGALAGFLLGKLLGHGDLDCLKIAQTLAAEILQVRGAVATNLDRDRLLQLVLKYYPADE
jgi:pseudouridine kinase